MPPTAVLLPLVGAALGYSFAGESGAVVGAGAGWVTQASLWAHHFPDGTYDPLDFQNALLGRYTFHGGVFPSPVVPSLQSASAGLPLADDAGL